MNIVAIIPARAGSKRLPGKNTIDLDGKPLIHYTITAARQSRYIDRILISTNDQHVKDAAQGVEIIWRPEELANDQSKVEDAIVHAVSQLEQGGYKTDIIVLLQPTSPLRTAQDIDSTIDAITKKGADSAQTFARAMEHPSLMVTIDEEGVPHPIDQENHLKHGQSLKKVYIKTGSVYACTNKVLEETKNIYGKKHLAIITPHERGIDIDRQEDLELALYYLKRK